MEAWSRQHYNKREKLAAVLDGEVLSIAAVQDGAILSSNAVIQGTFAPEYVTSLVNLLQSGSLPVDLKLLSSEKVDPTIGSHALDRIIVAGAISFGVITLFLLSYYAFPGLVAFLALCLYVLFTLTALKLINATFTLAGIAGFILSVGMAVDANILIFERMKEELRGGRQLRAAVDTGFGRAWPSIRDSNISTLITCTILWFFGRSERPPQS
jgi:protein-export membrane protein SecD